MVRRAVKRTDALDRQVTDASATQQSSTGHADKTQPKALTLANQLLGCSQVDDLSEELRNLVQREHGQLASSTRPELSRHGEHGSTNI